jgi:hypothetical protein
MRVLDVRRETKHGVGAVLKCRVAFWGCECWITTGLRCSESSMRRRRSGIISDAGLLQLDMEHPCIYYNINGTDRPITCRLASAQCLFPSMKPPNICISYSARDQPTNQPTNQFGTQKFRPSRQSGTQSGERVLGPVSRAVSCHGRVMYLLLWGPGASAEIRCLTV